MRRIAAASLRVGSLFAVALVAAGPGSPDCSQDSTDLTPDTTDDTSGDSAVCWDLYQPCLVYAVVGTTDCNSYLETESCPDLPNPDCAPPYFHCQWESFDTEAECRAMLAVCNGVPVGASCKDYFKACLLADLGWGGCEILFGGDCLSMTEETDCEDLFFSCFQWRNPAATCGPLLDGRSCPALVHERAPDIYFACLKHGFDATECDAVLAAANAASEIAACDALHAQCVAEGIATGICDALFGDCNFTPPGEPGSEW
jgi:hypothetical protein